MGPDFERQTGVCESSLSALEQAASGFEPMSDVMNLTVVRLPGETPSDTVQQIAPAIFDEVQNGTSELDAALGGWCLSRA